MSALSDISNLCDDASEYEENFVKVNESNSFSSEWIDSQAESMGISGVGSSLRGICDQGENNNEVISIFIHELLNRLKKSRDTEEFASDTVRSLEGKIDRMETEIVIKSRALIDTEQEKANLRLRVDEVSAQRQSEKKISDERKKEQEKCVHKMISRDIQYQATIRKRENDFIKLQKHVQNQVSQKSRASRGKFFDLSTPLGTNSGGIIGPDTATQKILAGMSARQAELLNENSELRGLVNDFQEERDSLFRRVEEIERQVQDNSSEHLKNSKKDTSYEPYQFPTNFFELPMTWLSGKVAEEFNADFSNLNSRIEKAMGSLKRYRLSCSDESVIEKLTQIIDEQNKLLSEIALQSDMATGYHERSNGLDFSMIVEKEETLKREKAHLEFEKEELTKEKEKVARELVDLELTRFGELMHGGSAGTLHMSSATPGSVFSSRKTPRSIFSTSKGKNSRLSFDSSPIHLSFLATPSAKNRLVNVPMSASKS